MKERGIIFTGPSIPAIQEDRKTQTRRVMDPQPKIPACFEWRCEHGIWYPYDDLGNWLPCYEQWRCRFGVPGDRFWVRETWGIGDSNGRLVDPCLNYRADGRQVPFERHGPDWCVNGQCVFEEDLVRIPSGWRSPRFMYRWASRITLELTDVRAPQRVQDISEEDAIAEGVSPLLLSEHRVCGVVLQSRLAKAAERYRNVWDSLNAHRGHPWENNDWVWPLTFRRVTTAH